MNFYPPDLAALRQAKQPCDSPKAEGYIYVLFHGDVPVYVGQAKSVYYVHTKIIADRGEAKEFDSVALVAGPVEALNVMQAEYIIQLRPLYNEVLPQQEVYVSWTKVARWLKTQGVHGRRRALRKAGVEELFLSTYRYADLRAKGFIP